MKGEKGFSLIDISISIIILFTFVSVIVFLIYDANTTAREIEYKSIAISLAIEEIEKIKNNSFENYANLSTKDGNGTINENEETETENFFKTIIVEDYTDIRNTGISGLVKKVTVKINYKFKGEFQEICLSTIISKEN